MCGIFGHYIFGKAINRKEVLDVLFCGLRRLEYRGYDSAGFSIESEPFYKSIEDDGAFAPAPIIVKSKGNIHALEAELAAASLDLTVEFKRHVGASPDEVHHRRVKDCR
jgi:glutamine---fructose-6-phosphate transaminase (isomerizing)